MALEEVRQKIEELYRSGIKTVVFEYSMGLGNGFAGFTQHWYEILRDLTALLKSLGMSFYIQDAAPFPTGAANGWFKKSLTENTGKFIWRKGIWMWEGQDRAAVFWRKTFSTIRFMNIFPIPAWSRKTS